MNTIESKIIGLLNQGIPLRARDIAKALSVPCQEVSHYLYTSLNGLVMQDPQCRWMLKSALQMKGEQLSIPLERQLSTALLDELLIQHQRLQQENALQNTLKSLLHSPED
jgi:hypothetical protein